jgi:hypothetical protein
MLIFYAKSINPEKYREIKDLRHSRPGGGPVNVQTDSARSRSLHEMLKKNPKARAAAHTVVEAMADFDEMEGEDVETSDSSNPNQGFSPFF